MQHSDRVKEDVRVVRVEGNTHQHLGRLLPVLVCFEQLCQLQLQIRDLFQRAYSEEPVSDENWISPEQTMARTCSS